MSDRPWIRPWLLVGGMLTTFAVALIASLDFWQLLVAAIALEFGVAMIAQGVVAYDKEDHR